MKIFENATMVLTIVIENTTVPTFNPHKTHCPKLVSEANKPKMLP